jgi:hypothetical protein
MEPHILYNSRTESGHIKHLREPHMARKFDMPVVLYIKEGNPSHSDKFCFAASVQCVDNLFCKLQCCNVKKEDLQCYTCIQWQTL